MNLWAYLSFRYFIKLHTFFYPYILWICIINAKFRAMLVGHLEASAPLIPSSEHASSVTPPIAQDQRNRYFCLPPFSHLSSTKPSHLKKHSPEISDRIIDGTVPERRKTLESAKRPNYLKRLFRIQKSSRTPTRLLLNRSLPATKTPFFIVLIGVSLIRPTASTKDAARLFDDLLSDYNKLVRPVDNNATLVVTFKLKLSQLLDVVSFSKWITIEKNWTQIWHCLVTRGHIFITYLFFGREGRL